jgi:hypothetical protein
MGEEGGQRCTRARTGRGDDAERFFSVRCAAPLPRAPAFHAKGESFRLCFHVARDPCTQQCSTAYGVTWHVQVVSIVLTVVLLYTSSWQSVRLRLGTNSAVEQQ